jgi:superoxide reductase
MKELKDLFQTADWKKEKHVPVIEVPDKIKKGEEVKVQVSVGKEIPHPNKTEHHIVWIDVYFHPADGKFPFHLGRFEFCSHGASTDGPDTSTIYTKPYVAFMFKTEKKGTLVAASYCNIHGLWTSARDVEVT